MAIPILIAVVTTQVDPIADLDLIGTILVVVFAAGVGWFLWRRK